jgi:hypothetical protein
MNTGRRHGWIGRLGAVVLVCALCGGPSLGQAAFALMESEHVCSCAMSADGSHHCRCPKCRGSGKAEVNGPVLAEDDCEDDGDTPFSWLMPEVLLPAAILCVRVPTPPSFIPEPIALHSQHSAGPDRPPPRQD